MDLAASVQVVTEEIMLRMARHVHRETGMENLCLAGGVALNCVGNGRLLREGPFKRLWIQPAAGDAGGALGVALAIYHKVLGNERTVTPARSTRMKGSYLGPAYTDDEIETFLDASRAPSTSGSRPTRCSRARPKRSRDEKVVGWFQGRMEFGPRSLGGAQHPRRPALAEDAVGHEPEDQVPRELPAVRAERAARARRGVLRARRATRRTCCWSRR